MTLIPSFDISLAIGRMRFSSNLQYIRQREQFLQSELSVIHFLKKYEVTYSISMIKVYWIIVQAFCAFQQFLNFENLLGKPLYKIQT